jgi:hypothetical protein
MEDPNRLLARIAGLVCAAPLVLLLAFLVAAPASGAAGSAGGDTVVTGNWTVNVKVVKASPGIGSFVDAKWTIAFGDNCKLSAPCTFHGGTAKTSPTSTQLEPSGGGFGFTIHYDLDCYDPATNQTTTKHGADYDAVGTLVPSDTQQRDGVTYVTAMSGTLVETLTINARGQADDCKVDGELSATQRSTLTGTQVPLPEVASGATSGPVGVGPGSANHSGTMGAFTLPLRHDGRASRAAVEAGRRSSVPGALTVPSDALRSLRDRLPQDLLLVAALGLLMVFPAQIFNSTYEENHERIERKFPRLRRTPTAAPATDGAVTPSRPPGRARRVGVFLACGVVGTLLGGLLDPKFGANRATAALLIGVFLSLLVAVAVATAAGWTFRSVRHRSHSWYLRAIPSGLLIAVICLLVSRLTHFQPGYLYGVLGGAVFAGSLERKTEGRVEAVTLLTGLLVALGAWVGFEPVAHAANGLHPGFGVLIADSLLGSLFIGGIEGLLFSLIPLRFLPGHRLRQWGWIPWLLLTALTLFVFVHVLLTPEAGYLGRSTAASTNVTLALFGAFAVVSVGFWAWFRFRPDPSGRPEAGSADAPTTSISAGGGGMAVVS